MFIIINLIILLNLSILTSSTTSATETKTTTKISKTTTINPLTISILQQSSTTTTTTTTTKSSKKSNISRQKSSSSSSLINIKKLSDRNEQQSILNVKKNQCEQQQQQQQQQQQKIQQKQNENNCPIVWDGALCWPQTKSNNIRRQKCPSYIKGFNRMGYAYKNCTNTGQWYFNTKTNNYWTNYTECSKVIIIDRINNKINFNDTDDDNDDDFDDIDDDQIDENYDNQNYFENNLEQLLLKKSKISNILPHLTNFQIISHIGYTISFISLIIAFFIFIYVKFICRRLRCPRNNLHIQLFISFIMRSSMYLIKTSLDTFPFNDDQWQRKFKSNTTTNNNVEKIKNLIEFKIENKNDLLSSLSSSSDLNDWTNLIKHFSNVKCKIFTTIWIYSLLANYNWIFMEGLYLHNVIFLNIFNDNSNIIPYVILGWCLPIPIVITWALMKSLYEDVGCWTTNNNFKIFWIMRAPITIVIFLNFIFFINIIRVLFLKMFAKSAATYNQRKYKYRTWFRSTLVLVPLFGVHYVFFSAFTSISFNSNDIYEIIWLYSDLTFTTFQGCLVALLYCFFNHEVQIELKKLWLS